MFDSIIRSNQITTPRRESIMDMIAISWLSPTELELVVDIDEDEPVFDNQKWKPGDQEEVTILDDYDGHVDMEFGNGSVAYHVDKTLFEKVDE